MPSYQILSTGSILTALFTSLGACARRGKIFLAIIRHVGSEKQYDSEAGTTTPRAKIPSRGVCWLHLSQRVSGRGQAKLADMNSGRWLMPDILRSPSPHCLHSPCFRLSSCLLDTDTWGHIASSSAAGGSQGQGRGNNIWRTYIKKAKGPFLYSPLAVGMHFCGTECVSLRVLFCLCVCTCVSTSTHSICGKVKGQLGWVGFLFLPR